MINHILAIDTSTDACSVAIWCKGLVFEKCSVSPLTHTKIILPMIEQCLIDANLDLPKIDILAFGHGPGSFTGLRIAVGIAQGLGFGANIPITGISSMLTIAQGAYYKLGVGKVLIAIDAKNGEIYSACYEMKQDGSWQGENSEEILKPAKFLAKINQLSGYWAIAGTGWSIYPRLKTANLLLLESGINSPKAKDMLPIALQLGKKLNNINIENAQPVYLHNNVKWKKLPGR